MIICLFIVNLDAIQTSLRNTGVVDRLMNRPVREQDAPPPGLEDGDDSPAVLPAPVPDALPPEREPPAVSRDPNAAAPEVRDAAGSLSGETPAGQAAPTVPPAETPSGQTAPAPSVETPRQTVPARPGQPAAQQSPQDPAETRRERVLYFMQVDPDGTIVRTRTTRNLPVTDSPMVDVLNTLLQGPSVEETNRGLISLIPKGTRVLSAVVRGSTAYINFNEHFLFNEYGVEGYAGQLRQVVLTVTEFSTVKDVQVLVEGRRLDYLGESIWIGSPVGREFP